MVRTMSAINALVMRPERIAVVGAKKGGIRSSPVFCRSLCDVQTEYLVEPSPASKS